MTTRRDVLIGIPAMGTAFAVGGSMLGDGGAQAQEAPPPLKGHFHPKGKAPSVHTVRVLKEAAARLPFSDKSDLDEWERGLIARRRDLRIMADAGNVALDMAQFKFLDQEEPFDSVHPSLHRIGRLNNNYGLYRVAPGVYQTRGLDLANLTFVRGKSGWIVVDPVTTTESARASWELLQEHVGEGLPVSAVIYSHTHIDHWGGVRGVPLKPEDIASGKIQIIAPEGFLDFAISENVFAGNAMNRRLFYQYGILLPPAPHGSVGIGPAAAVPAGATALIAPNRLISAKFEELEVDGVRVVFQTAPNTEAPRTMNVFFPDLKTLFVADMIFATLHNLYTLRGAQVRDALAWSKSLNETLQRFGPDTEVMCAGHNWPRFGKERVAEVIRAHRDIYANLNNQVLHHANQGVTINQIHNVYKLPKSLENMWFVRGYHGHVTHNARAVVQRFLGFWDCNPVNLAPLSPEDSAPLYVEMMGGAERIIARGQELFNEGKYLLAMEIVNKLVQAEPQNEQGKELLADIFEQLGYQAENGGHRNSYLAAAYELRSGIPQGAVVSSSPDVVRAMSTELFLNFLGVKMDSRKAEGLRFTMNLVTPDNGEKFLVELSNATLNNIAGYLAENPDLTLTLNRSDLEKVMAGEATLEALLGEGRATAEGDLAILGQLAALMVEFDPRFEIMPGTKGRTEMPEAEPFEGDIGAAIPE
ncbi:MAG: MBL fold metallo-hydrolase [Hyphomicrobium sp.]|nr:MBL fold metallo-hydrolase [Hyphomicrobium sp.]